MKSASISEAKNGLSALIERVRAGESVVITDRGVAVATLEPITRLADPTGRLERLERAGIVRRSLKKGPPAILDESAPRTLNGSSVVETLLEERRVGR